MQNQLFSFLFLISFAFSISAQTQEAQKIDEFESVKCDEYLNRMDNAILNVTNTPNSKIYIFVYEGRVVSKTKYDSKGEFIGYDYVYPPFGLAKAKIRSMKEYLKMRKIPQENYIFVEAGFLENFKVEFWNVPKGASPPIPSPTLKKMKYRKGKPTGFCTGCC